MSQGLHSLTELLHCDTYSSLNGKFKYHVSAEGNIHLARDNTVDVSHVSGSEKAQLGLWSLRVRPVHFALLVCACVGNLVNLRGSRFQGICACPAASPRVFTPTPSLFISAGILIRALRAPAGEVRRKLCFLTANKNRIISLIQVAHLKKNTN